MLEYSPKNIRTWSILGSRGTFGVALAELAKKNEAILALSSDLCTTSGLDRFRVSFPERFVNTGIAEQNLIGVAAGLAAGGYIPFASSFSNFIALRACEQMRHFLGYMHENVKAVGLAAGFAMGMFGVTHYGIEDIAALRAISGLTILSPADCTETAKAVEAAARFDGPVYLRLTGGMNAPIVYKQDYGFEIGKAVELKEGRDVAIIATGSMVHNVLMAAQTLESQGISCTVIDMHTVKPLDKQALNSLLCYGLIVTVEEHSVTGGLGSAVAEYYSMKEKNPQVLRLGVPQGYPAAGSGAYLVEFCGLTPECIAAKIEKMLHTNKTQAE